MKKKMAFVLFVALLLIPFWMWLGWVLTPVKPLKCLIVDKTVLRKDGIEHRSFNWILEHQRYVTPDSQYYAVDKDYMGFFPIVGDEYEIHDLKDKKERDIRSMADSLDMIYYTDMYGIYTRDLYGDASLKSKEKNNKAISESDIFGFFKHIFGKKEAALERSGLIYGGMNDAEYNLMLEMKHRHKLILTEFNIIAAPTPPRLRKKVEMSFGFKWTGWVGRYFTDLDSTANPDLPDWVIRLYTQQHHGSWPFGKDGIVLVHEDETIEILGPEDLLETTPVIETGVNNCQAFGLPAKVIYPFWFDVMEVDTSVNDIISEYHLMTTHSGDSLLDKIGLKTVFPASFGHTGDYSFYYMCGDFSDNPVDINILTRLKGIYYLRYFLYNQGDPGDRRRFFWAYYFPFIQGILEENLVN